MLIGKAFGQGFTSGVSSFVWILMHDLLTTEERINSTIGNLSASYRFGCNVVANLEHCFFRCGLTNQVGNWLLTISRKFGTMNETDILNFDVPDNKVLIWILAMTLHFIWSKRVNSKRAGLQECIAHLKAELEMMKPTRYRTLADKINEAIS